MSEPPQLSSPVLAEPLLAPSLAGVAGAGLACAAVVAGILLLLNSSSPTPGRIPADFSQLDAGLVTPVPADDRDAVTAAVSALRLPQAQKLQIEQDVLNGRRRVGWIVFTDSMDPDGDQIAVETSGLVQHVTLNKIWTAVAVPLSGTPIGITAVRDGGGGGITVALGTRSGPVTLRVMVPGERIQVAAP